MPICKMPNQRMNWVCEGTNLYAMQNADGLVLANGKALVIRTDLIESLAKHNASFRYHLRQYGVREFIEGPHMHLVWDDGMRGLKL